MKALLSSRRGFSLLEVILVVVIATVTAIGIARVVTSHMRASVSAEKRKDMASLARMVLDLYGARAAQQFDGLNAYDVTAQPPHVLFESSDDLDFNSMLITTRTSYSVQHDTCAVSVDIVQTNTTDAHFHAERIFMDAVGTGTGGRTIYVTIKPRCQSYTSPADAEAHCPGAPGFKVSSVSKVAGQVVGYTDSQGTAILRNVAFGQVPLRVEAPQPSDFSVPSARPDFIQGYYRLSSGTYTRVWLETITVTSDTNPMYTTVTDFDRAGSIGGTFFIDPSGDDPSGKELWINDLGMLVATGGEYKRCRADVTCKVLSYKQSAGDVSGLYEFANVIMDSATVPVLGSGPIGSSPTVTTDSPNFVQGYINHVATLIRRVDQSWPMPPVAPRITVPYTTHRMGSFRLQITDADTGLPISNATIRITLREPPYFNYVTSAISLVSPTGTTILSNVFHSNSLEQRQNVTVNVSRTIGGVLYATAGKWWCPDTVNNRCWGQENVVPLPLSAGYSIVGTVNDDNPTHLYPGTDTSRLQGIKAQIFTTTGAVISQVGADASFRLDNVSLDSMDLVSGNRYTARLTFTNNFAGDSPTAFGGTVLDRATGAPAGGASFQVNLASGTLYRINALSDGTWAATIKPLWTEYENPQVDCDPSTHICTPVASAPIHLNTSISCPGFVPSSSSNGWDIGSPHPCGEPGGTYTTLSFTATLRTLRLAGAVERAGDGLGLPGVVIRSQDVVVSSKTSSGGSYNIWFPVRGRTATDPGHFEVEIPPQQTVNGSVYAGALEFVPLPPVSTPVDQSVPVLKDWSLIMQGGNGT